MSLQLVLAGLFPPQEDSMWKDGLYWQPVPYNYHQRHQDKVLLGTLCPKYLELYDEVSNSAEMLEEFAKFKETFDYISEHTGLKVTRFYDVYNLYFGISTEEEWGFQLPEWTETVWPETITTLAIKDYFVAMARTEMRKMATGYFLNKVLEDTKAKIFSSLQPGRKMHLYSAHENNIAELLISLGVFEPHVPNYGAYVILEIHRVDNVYGVMIFYENYDGDGPRRLKMPECEVFCPLDKFMTLVQDYIPPDDLCGR
uniref:acid phosphatase n=2 Tax=Anoplophora glabripennis TaxID=217634 RepID=V5I8W2_ANOGL